MRRGIKDFPRARAEPPWKSTEPHRPLEEPPGSRRTQRPESPQLRRLSRRRGQLPTGAAAIPSPLLHTPANLRPFYVGGRYQVLPALHDVGLWHRSHTLPSVKPVSETRPARPRRAGRRTSAHLADRITEATGEPFSVFRVSRYPTSSTVNDQDRPCESRLSSATMPRCSFRLAPRNDDGSSTPSEAKSMPCRWRSERRVGAER